MVTQDIPELKSAEEALLASEEQLTAPVMMHAIDRDAKLVTVSDYWLKALGYTRDDVLGRPLTDFMTEASRQYAQEVSLPRFYRDGFVTNFHAQLVKKSGEVIDTLLSAIAVKDQAGNFLRSMAVVTDITERKHTEEQLQASEERYRSVIETAASAIIHLSADHKILEWNPAAARIYGWKRHEVLGKDYLELFLPEEVRETVAADMQRVLAGEHTESFENPVRTRDGVERVLSWNVSRLVDAKGRAIGIVAIGMDITERKRAEEALLQSEANYRRLVDNSLGLMCTHDLRGDLLSINPAAAEALGYRPEDCVGRNIRGALPPSVRHLFDDYLERTRQNRNDSGLMRLVTKEGDERIWFYRNVIYEQPGSTPRVLGHALDITDRKRAEEALQESQESLRASEERYRTLIESSPYCIHEIDLEGRFSSMNPAGLSMMGVTDERDIKGMPYLDVVSDDDRDRIRKLLALAYQGKPSEYEFMAVNGVSYQSSFVPITDDNSVVIKLMGLTQDITERKRAQGELESALADVARLKDQLQAENIYLREEIDLDHHFGEIIGQSEDLKKLLVKVKQVAATDATVLILGETGTGKELFARAIHRLSQRKDRPLVKVSCAALPPSLIENELFGHTKGAFTGAVSRQVGRFELADGATIFLDEVGELPLDLQAKLLRVLEEGEFECLGNPRTFKVDVRVIAATNRDLEGAIRDGGFRADLYHRLSVFPLALPPLRERRDDIPMLVQSFVNGYGQKLGKVINTIPELAMKALQSYSWPGNIRELENVIERAVIITQGSALRVEDTLDPRRAMASELTEGQTLENVERDYIKRILEQTKWRIEGRSGAAVVLGLNPGTLRSRMQKLGIRRH
ncbi:MAG: PAS domain S-box protein [Gammaproteobacteria bacterium]|nr:PAS domain S-box protein [Gammaproteobacteria bacterium]